MSFGQNKSGPWDIVKSVAGAVGSTLTILSIALACAIGTICLTVFVSACGVIASILILALTPIAMATKSLWLGWLKADLVSSNGIKATKKTSDYPTEPISNVMKN